VRLGGSLALQIQGVGRALVTMISVRDLYCGYNSNDVLRGVTFDVGRGEFVAVLGANGSGKTTLLRALTGLLPIRRGAVTLDGKSVSTMRPIEVARLAAVVPQESTIAFDFRVRDVVLMGRTPHVRGLGFEGRSDNEVADRAMALAGISDLADRPLSRLSGGEKQRVTIARALAQETPILLLDEPTAHLDLNYQIAILGLVREVTRGQGLTALGVIHDVNLASLFSERVVMLAEGRVEADGPPVEVITAESIRRVYGAVVTVSPHPETGRPLVHPVAGALEFASDLGAPH
jgi:iron complex transport system ATP-binding protein